MKQATWDQFVEPESETSEKGLTNYSGRPLDPDAGCPWCLAPPDSFKVSESNGDFWVRKFA